MTARVQIVARIPVELSRRVRATAKKRKQPVNTVVIEALDRATQPTRPPREKKPTEGA